jgi:serine O-acetyltransferase
MKNNIVGKIFNLSRSLHLKKIPLIPKFLWTINRILFSCDLPFKADVDETVYFVHNGLGVVIHDNCKIGKGTQVLQHVTIGGNVNKQKEIDGLLTNAPVIGTNVLCGVGAKILGPVKIGNNARIGAGSVVLSDVPDNSVVVGVPAKIIRILEDNDITA